MARRKTELSKVDVFYISHNAHEMTTEAIARDLNVEEDLIIKYLEENPVPEVPAQELPKPPNAYDLMGKNKKKTAVTMTPAASMLGDEERKNFSSPISRLNDAVTTARADK